MSDETTRIEVIPYIFYRDVPAALDWLARAFGFTETHRSSTPRGGVHGEMEFGGRTIMLGQPSAELRTPGAAEAATQGVFVYLAGVDAHYRRALAAGARIEKPPVDLPYGRSYTAHDPEGHPWFFTEPPPDAN